MTLRGSPSGLGLVRNGSPGSGMDRGSAGQVLPTAPLCSFTNPSCGWGALPAGSAPRDRTAEGTVSYTHLRAHETSAHL
eukprot:3612372-Alexandrium_andersonii.AAC.1